MEPTSDQIQHAAYERWLRRGRIHGHHDGDWFGAEKELAFLLNYQTFVEYPLVSAEPRVLDNASIRRAASASGRTVRRRLAGPRR